MLIHRGRYIQEGSGVGGILGRQRGGGFGSLFSSALRFILPWLKSTGKAVLQSPMTKNVLSAAKEGSKKAGLNLLSDAIAGKDLKESLGKNVGELRESVGQALKDSPVEGAGRKRKTDVKAIGETGQKKKKKKASEFLDVFS